MAFNENAAGYWSEIARLLREQNGGSATNVNTTISGSISESVSALGGTPVGNELGNLRLLVSLVSAKTGVATGVYNENEAGYLFEIARLLSGGTPPTSSGTASYLRTIQAKLAEGAATPTGFICDGDSITEGPNYLEIAPARPAILATLTGLPATNLGVSGRTLATMDSTFVSRGVGALYNAESANTLVLHGGINDIGNTPGITLAALQASMTSYCGKARAAGFRVVVGTVLPTIDLTAPQNAMIVDFNAWLRASAETLGVVVADYDEIPEAADPENITYYVDGLHPQVRLLDLMALKEAEALGVEVVQLNPNPGAATGAGGWLTYAYTADYDLLLGAPVLSVVSGRFRLTCPDVENIYPEAQIVFGGFTPGASYRLSYDLVTVNAGGPPVIFDSSGARAIVHENPGDMVDFDPPHYPAETKVPGTITQDFVATAASQTVYVELFSETPGAYIDFDNVRVVPL